MTGEGEADAPRCWRSTTEPRSCSNPSSARWWTASVRVPSSSADSSDSPSPQSHSSPPATPACWDSPASGRARRPRRSRRRRRPWSPASPPPAVAGWASGSVPRVEPLPRRRSTVVDLARRLTRRTFLIPTTILAASTGALSLTVGFLPILAESAGASVLIGGAMVSAASVCAAVAQPWAGRALDAERLGYRTGAIGGLAVCVAGLTLTALAPSLPGLALGAVGIGLGAGVLTPLGFSALAGSAPPERLGETMGSAEVGRELGDAGGPLLVGAVAATATLSVGIVGAAVAVALVAVAATDLGRDPTPSD